jgi:hypothetical protein
MPRFGHYVLFLELPKMRRQIMSSLMLAATFAFLRLTAMGEVHAAVAVIAHPTAILWTNPVDIKSRNLYYGPGGKEDQPKEPLTFLKEDAGGSNPKFYVRDRTGTKWKVKLGLEAQPETVATRLMWAVGFVTNENYFLLEAKVKDMPPRLKRGQELVGANGDIRAVRLQKPLCGKKVGTWSWKHNRFKGTREFNGLRVMMALLSNWDLKDENNAIHADCGKPGTALYEVSDLGASFGSSGESYTQRESKNNLAAYRRSKFISKVTPNYVSFNFPTHLPFLYVFNVPLFFSELNQRWIGHHIPRSDAKWIGSYLAELSPKQIRDAFRAAGYSPEQVEVFATTVEARIAELKRL